MLTPTRYGDKEEQDPRNTNFGPHLQIHTPDSGVQTRAHENVVGKVARHAHRLAEQDSKVVDAEADGESVNHRDGHEGAEVVDDLREAEGVGCVEEVHGNQRGVERGEGVAVVFQGLVV